MILLIEESAFFFCCCAWYALVNLWFVLF
uniref:Uncharacterized protein n=1 Tax=Rhizophora mucronata TaxID=61149 RepID=A0A2P2PG58_RHIMU